MKIKKLKKNKKLDLKKNINEYDDEDEYEIKIGMRQLKEMRDLNDLSSHEKNKFSGMNDEPYGEDLLDYESYAEILSNTGLNLPSSANLKEKEIKKICNIVNNFI